MQPAEEIEGPTEQDDIHLMERIATEATERVNVYRASMVDTYSP